jgi:CubicO group peptidase (beta-lactamase class C family)
MKTNIILIFFICLTSCKNTDIKKGSIDQSFKENLFFSKTDSSIKNSSTIELTNNFILNKDEFLKAQFTLDKPLVESIKILAPELTTDQLLEKGNFQFSFLVDGELIYIENLQKGAGLKDSKTKQLQHNIPLISPNQLDFWGWFMWLKFMKIGGGQDALDEGNHTLTIEVRPYIKQETLKIGEILAKGSLQINVPEIIVDKNLIPLQTIKPNSGWEISTDNFDTNKIEALNKKIAQKRFEDINGIVVIKNNKLLIEEYFNGENRETLHNPRSVGKTITSTIMGIAIEENYITSENAKLKDFYDLKSFKNYSTKKDDVTLKSLLTMSSGFLGDDNDYNNPGNEENMYPTKDWVKFALDLPMEKEIGKEFSYFTAGVVVLGDILHKSVPKGLVSYADKKLFSPLNITKYQWEYTPQKVGNTAGGLRLNALDFAKYGQLYKNKGLWNGKQILSKDWVKKSLSKQINRSEDNGYYGYLFWNKTYKINYKEYEVSFCSGRGGNKIFIFKDIPYVIVITASAYNVPNAHQNIDKMMTDYMLPSLLEKQ